MAVNKLMARGTTKISLHDRFSRLQALPVAPPAASRPRPEAFMDEEVADDDPYPYPIGGRANSAPFLSGAAALSPYRPMRSASYFPSRNPQLGRPVYLPRYQPPVGRAWDHRAATMRAALKIKRRSMVHQRLGVRPVFSYGGVYSHYGRGGGSARGRARWARGGGRGQPRRRGTNPFLGRGGRGRSRGGSTRRPVSKEELDTQLERYMAQTKTHGETAADGGSS